MQVVGRYWNTSSRLWTANVPAFVASFRNMILFLGIFGISLLYIASAKFPVGPFANIVVPSVMVILGSMLLVGKRALMITSFDYYFVGFAGLSFVSHIAANEFLFRTLGMPQLQLNLTYIFTMAVLFRAYFCLTLLAPQLSSRLYVAASMLVLGFVAVLGILQRFGPGKSTAIHIGCAISKNFLQIQDATLNGRTTGVFTNPNILGYAICVFAAVILGWGLMNIENISILKTVSVVLLMGLAILGTIACQSRQSAIVLVFAPIVFAVVLRLKAKNQWNFWVLAAMTGVAVFGLVSLISVSKSTYLVKVSKTGLKGDQSFQARQYEFELLRSVSGDIAAGGEGQQMSNVNPKAVAIEHSKYNTSTIDSEWGNAFQGFGVWGPLLLALFYLFTAVATRDVWQIGTPESRMIASIGLVLLAFNLVLTITAVRVSKFESAGFTFELLGVLSAWRLIGTERRLLSTAVQTTS